MRTLSENLSRSFVTQTKLEILPHHLQRERHRLYKILVAMTFLLEWKTISKEADPRVAHWSCPYFWSGARWSFSCSFIFMLWWLQWALVGLLLRFVSVLDFDWWGLIVRSFMVGFIDGVRVRDGIVWQVIGSNNRFGLRRCSVLGSTSGCFCLAGRGRYQNILFDWTKDNIKISSSLLSAIYKVYCTGLSYGLCWWFSLLFI